MPSQSRSRCAALFGVLALMSIAGCGGSVAVEKTGAPGGKNPESAGVAGSSPGTVTGAGASGSSYPPSQGVAPCCNLAFACDSDDQTLSSSTECPSGAECYSRTACCNVVTYCAHWPTVDAGPPTVDAGPPTVDAGPPTVDAGSADGGVCSLLGNWHTHSAPWNNESTDAAIVFASNGTLSGTPAFVGKWDLEGSQLTIHDTVGSDMNCSYADRWTLTFSPDCQTAPLLPIGSGCTGARRYLDWNVTLTRD